MNQALREAVRELKLDPARPVRVYVEGLVIELRAIQSFGGGVVTSPWALEAVHTGDPDGLRRLGRLMASARALTASRRGANA